MTEPTDNQEIEAGELASRGLHTCAVCRLPRATTDRSVCETCVPSEETEVKARLELQQAWAEAKANRESAAWWQGVAEAKQEERDKLRAALELLSQVRHVSGSAQAAFRCNLKVIDAALAGADFRDADVTEAVVAGTWKPTKHPAPGPQ